MARKRGSWVPWAAAAAGFVVWSRSRQGSPRPLWGPTKYTNITLERAWFTASAAGAYRLHVEFWEEHNYGWGKSGSQGSCDTARFKVQVRWRNQATGAEDLYDFAYSGKPNNNRNRYAEDVPIDVAARPGEPFSVSLFIHDFDCTNLYATGQDWIDRESNALTTQVPAAMPPGQEPSPLPPGREDPCAVYGGMTDPADPTLCMCPSGTVYDKAARKCLPPEPVEERPDEGDGNGGAEDPYAYCAKQGLVYDASKNLCVGPTDGADQQKMIIYGLVGLGAIGVFLAMRKPGRTQA